MINVHCQPHRSGAKLRNFCNVIPSYLGHVQQQQVGGAVDVNFFYRFYIWWLSAILVSGCGYCYNIFVGIFITIKMLLWKSRSCWKAASAVGFDIRYWWRGAFEAVIAASNGSSSVATTTIITIANIDGLVHTFSSIQTQSSQTAITPFKDLPHHGNIHQLILLINSLW